jgi:hypothetical protein
MRRLPSSLVATGNADVVAAANGLTMGSAANGGSQFSLEPPDQALASAETSWSGREQPSSLCWLRGDQRASRRQDINTFFGYPAAVNRTTGVIGPNVIDPRWHYDPDNNRFMVVITTLRQRQRTDSTGRTPLTWRSPTPVIRRGLGPSTTSRRRTTAPTARPTTAARSTARRPVRASRTTRTSAVTATAST